MDAIQSSLHFKENTQRFIITITETQENAKKISKQIEKQIDVLNVDLFEQTK